MPNGLESCAVKWPSPAEREQYKQWVEDMSCAEWRDRWYMIDGTLVSIFARPHYYGDIFFDRKSNYSFVQVCQPPLALTTLTNGLFIQFLRTPWSYITVRITTHFTMSD
ncbi:hypothetical protein V1524DRAFT_50997 [Lipomyces starkeyi]